MRRCRGSVAETLFAPLLERLRADGCQVLGGQLVQQVVVDERGVTSVVARCVSARASKALIALQT